MCMYLIRLQSKQRNYTREKLEKTESIRIHNIFFELLFAEYEYIVDKNVEADFSFSYYITMNENDKKNAHTFQTK